MKKAYLCCPYSVNAKDNPALRTKRYLAANRAAGILMKMGYCVFSPISHSHPISLAMGNSMDHDFWLAQDRSFVEWADEIFVLCLPDWKKSDGIGKERSWAGEKPIHYVHLEKSGNDWVLKEG